ncbi:MAG: 3-deoxy-manno-octulosonate cytidylyltransferase [Acidobacteriota bacterium]
MPDAGIVGAIPARFGSTRLPGKPLRPLAGRTMIEHVYRRVASVPSLDRTVVLTDDDRIAEAVRGFGGEVEMTPEDCASGTDRIAWAARRWAGVSAVVNVQGDEPLLDPKAVDRLARHLRDTDDGMATLAAPFETGGDGDRLHDPHAVKVVLDRDGYALYFSRAPIPFPRNAEGSGALLHLGLYAYRTEVLLRLAELPPSPLERRESLEQLRALENRIPIRVLELDAPAHPGVDTEDDLARAEALLRGAPEPAAEPGDEP